MAVYRVTLPSGGLDRWKWAGRPPPPAPEDLYTGPRRDGLLSTEEISGDYRCCCFPIGCDWMTVVPLGADTIETWRTDCVFFPPWIGPTAEGAVRTRDPGTNAFRNPQNSHLNSDLMTFSADGTVKHDDGDRVHSFTKRSHSPKRTFHKVETRDLAGNWRGCQCWPVVPLWPFSCLHCTKKMALNEDQYEESGRCFVLGLPCPVETTTRTRRYVNGHATNAFPRDGSSHLFLVHWYRDPGCAAQPPHFFAKKVG